MLPAPALADYSAREYAAPAGETELTVAAIWQAVLGVPRVGCHDGFFDLGGHSLLARRVISTVRTTFALSCRPVCCLRCRPCSTSRGGSTWPPVCHCARPRRLALPTTHGAWPTRGAVPPARCRPRALRPLGEAARWP
ncbi:MULTISPECIES: phosphopantetheine-binding protein [Burkholderia]|uniref:phosphopantetheine-binding protein n=1 Tax=Burkholderia TaxID=32008 RepID=UPI000D0110E4|nr:hypothetical protein C6Q13_18725 [Burkholderia gladioli]RQZ76074.1 hypothetical protein DF052_02650 [Burkholderia glumae]